MIGRLLGCFGVVLAPIAMEAQETPLLTVTGPVAAYADGLGSLRGVRELADGRVLIADGLGEALIVWTPGQGADTLTNVGEGPEEYQVPDGLYPLPNDATLLVDLGNARLVEISSDLSFGETRPIAQGGMSPGQMGSMVLLIPTGTDEHGRIYYQQRIGGMMGTADSAIIARFDPVSEETDELGKVKRPEQNREESGGSQNRSVMIRPVPMSPEDAWNVSWDGRVAVARSADYRLEWIGPDGLVTSGPTVSYDPVRVGRADQEEWLDALGGGLGISIESDGGAPRMSFHRMSGSDRQADPGDLEWPDVKPAFPAGAVRIDATGRAWVLRYGRAGDAPVYDVFDPAGRRIAQVELPEGRRLVGFGEGSLYLSRTDDLDFAWLEKYETPAF